MRIKLDENIDIRIISQLRQFGYLVKSISHRFSATMHILRKQGYEFQKRKDKNAKFIK
jgi:hypothetical protein